MGSRFVGEYDATTLGGYLIEKLRDMPKQGVEFTHDNLKFSILRVEKRRISQVLMYINQPNP